MANDPDTSVPTEPLEQAEPALVAQRAVRTGGGAYAEGDIDQRQGTFIADDQYNLDGHFPGATIHIKSPIYQAPREALPAFQAPYQPIPLIGREAALAELSALLTGDAPVVLAPAIAGMGGVGKTMLAATFAHQHQAAFPGGIFWLNMEQPDLIAGQVAACAGPGGLDLPDYAALAFDERIARVRAAWNSPVRRLLVLDNLEDPTLLTRWQPTGSGARVLITTRRDDWPRQVQRLRLPVLQRPRSIELLLGARADDKGVTVEHLLADPAERAAAAAICDLLGDLPLALAIAAALLRLNASLRLHEFHDQIVADPLFTAPVDTNLMQEVLREAGLPTGRERGIAASFAISYRQFQSAEELDVQALRMLHAAAYCAPAPLPQEALWNAAGLNPVRPESLTAGDAALRRLRALGLIGTPTGGDTGAISLHRLLAAFVRQQPHPQELLGATARALTSYTHALQTAGQIKRSRDLVPHLEAVLAHQLELHGSDHDDTLSTAHNLAITLGRQGDYAAARERYEAVLAAQTRLLGPEHPTTLGTATGLANTLYSQGDYAAAYSRYEAVLATQTRLLGPEHPTTLNTAMGLANTLYSQGDYAAARSRYEAVLATQTRILGPEAPTTLGTAMGLANTLSKQGDYAGARTRYEVVLTVQTRLFSPEHPDTLRTTHNLANTLSRQGDYAAARERYEAILAAYTRLLGPEHPDTLATAMGLANTLLNQGDYAAARERHEIVLATRSRLLGPEHPDTLVTANNLANTLSDQGDYTAARERHETVLAARSRLLGLEHPDTLGTANNLASALERLGRWRAAARLRMQVVASSERHLGSAHPDAIQYLADLSRNLGARGYQRTARHLLEARLRHLPEGVWRNVLQWLLFFVRARAVLTALLIGWLASGLVASTGGGWPVAAVIVLSAVLSYWSRWALIALFALAGAALAAPLSSGLPAPWSWLCLALATLAAGGVVPYGAPAIAWLLSATRLRMLLRPTQRLMKQFGQRSIAWLQASED